MSVDTPVKDAEVMRGLTLKDLDDSQLYYAANPRAFRTDVLGSGEMTDYQLEGFDTFMKEPFVAIASAVGMGKTFTITDAILALWYARGYCSGIEDGVPECAIIVTAPTFHQIKNIVFAELRKKHAKAHRPLGGQINTVEFRMNAVDKWYIIGLSPRKSADVDNATDLSNFQGMHAKIVRIVIEEGVGVPKDIWDKAEGMCTGGDVGIWTIFNPTDPNSEAAERYRKDFRFAKRKWSCFLSPNMIVNKLTSLNAIKTEMTRLRSLRNDEARMRAMQAYKVSRPELLTASFVMARALLWGIESPLFKAKVLAEFPDITSDRLVNIKDMERAMDPASLEEGVVAWQACKEISIGVDCARYGDDKSVIMPMHGNKELAVDKDTWALGTEEIWGRDTTFVAGRVKAHWKAVRQLYGPSMIVLIAIDVGGLGAGVVDQVKNDTEIAADELTIVYEVNFGESETDPLEDGQYGAQDALHFVNAASEMGMTLKTQFESPSGFILCQDDDLKGQLTDRYYKYDNKMRFWIESKEVYRKRKHGRSPDKGDAMMLAQYGYVLYGKTSGEAWNQVDKSPLETGGQSLAHSHGTHYRGRW